MARREFHDSLPSTQERALGLARHGAEPGTFVVAAQQTDGHGRADRRWFSPVGGLYLSRILGAPPSSAPELLSLAVGAETAEAVSAIAGVALRLKWPNDLVTAEPLGRARKVGGILTDRISTGSAGLCDVVGIGINLRPLPRDARADGRWTPAALDELTERRVSVAELESTVVAAIDRARAKLDRPDGAADVLGTCRRLLYGLGAPVSVDGVPAGTLVGLEADGSLRVGLGEAQRSVRAGEVLVLGSGAL